MPKGVYDRKKSKARSATKSTTRSKPVFLPLAAIPDRAVPPPSKPVNGQLSRPFRFQMQVGDKIVSIQVEDMK